MTVIALLFAHASLLFLGGLPATPSVTAVPSPALVVALFMAAALLGAMLSLAAYARRIPPRHKQK